ncbi:unnamed protein product [Protopolystoma xenopodis]|uniref:Uncharacterized protein n=1 Tax=Protopolystoma xenopodis TaxID=117903 RepID=A0A3S5FGH9_9PLAT|nr:unnamed protein product [Protopolystoma xenopodis]
MRTSRLFGGERTKSVELVEPWYGLFLISVASIRMTMYGLAALRRCLSGPSSSAVLREDQSSDAVSRRRAQQNGDPYLHGGLECNAADKKTLLPPAWTNGNKQGCIAVYPASSPPSSDDGNFGAFC